jgi:PAS domain S-box-containing protein
MDKYYLMKISFKNQIVLTFFLVSLGIIFLAWETYKNSIRYREAAGWVKHTEKVLYSAEQVLAMNEDVETASRGFVLTDKNEFLAPFDNGKKLAFLRLASLRELTKDNPSQQLRINRLLQLTKKKIEFSELTVKKRREDGFEAAKTLIAEGDGLKYMDGIRKVVSEIQSEENRLLKIREDINDKSNAAFNNTFLLHVVSMLVVIGAATVLIIYNLNARNKAEASLRENQQLLESIIDNTSSIIYVKDVNRKFILVNKSFQKLLGLSKDAIVGKTNFDVFPHHIAADFDETDKKVIYQKATVEVQEKGEFQGDVQSYISIKSPLYKGNGEVYGLCGISTDITEMKKQSNLIQDLYENAPCGYYSIDAEGRFVNVNKTTLKWLGYTKEELIGRPFEDILPEENSVDFEQIFSDFKATGHLIDREFIYLRKDKSKIIVLGSASAVYNNKGQFNYSRSTIFDITERKKLEAELSKAKIELESIEWFKLAGKATADAMWDWDISTGKLLWGEGFETLFGYKLKGLGSNINSWTLHIHSNDKERVIQHIFEVINSKDQTRWSDEYRYMRADGTYASVLDKGLVIRDENNIAYRMVGAMQDITDYKKNIEDLQQFSFIASHNFTAPLANMLGILSLIDESILDNYNKELFRMLERSTTKLRDTVSHLTEVLVVRNKNVELQNVELYEVFDKVYSTLLVTMKITKPEIVLDLKVPAIKSNAYYLESILQNLFTNSVKYQSPKRELSITLKTEKTLNGRTLLTWADNGVGIDLNRHRNKLFGMYQRFHDNTDGKGLGLFLIKSQITALGGNIEVHSELDKGTNFLITF